MDALLSLAIILLTGLIFEKIIRLFKLPNVTGYLIGGLLIGPSVLNLVTEGQLESLSFVSSIALGFIAFSIGGAFKMSYFKRV